jgi:hypothetical protein
MWRALYFFVPVLAAGVSLASAQVRVGSEFRVSSSTAANMWPSIASDPAGNFIVAWSRSSDRVNDFDAVARRYDAFGQPLGTGEFVVNSSTAGGQRPAAVAVDAAGRFTIAWYSLPENLAAHSDGIFGQRHDATGVPRGAEFRISAQTTLWEHGPALAADLQGNIVAVWRTCCADEEAVFAQRYDPEGGPRGGPFRVDTTTGRKGTAAVAADVSGNFVVLWSNDADPAPREWPPPEEDTAARADVFGQRYDAAGAPLAHEFRVNTSTTRHQGSPQVAMDAGGNFVVVWQSELQDGSWLGVFGQRYDASGQRRGDEFQVSVQTHDGQGDPSVSSDASGRFVVVWSAARQDGHGSGIAGRRYDASGQPEGGEFIVNSQTTGDQTVSRVASAADGGFVVTWMSREDPSSPSSPWVISAQRFSSALDAIFRDGFESADRQ